MRESTRRQKGSPSRDMFKWLHKNLLNKRFYALNSDLELVEKEPPFIVARLDFKVKGDTVSFSEAIAYNDLVANKDIPVFIVETARNFINSEPEYHRFDIYRYIYANWKPDPPDVKKEKVLENADWDRLGRWENEVRGSRVRCYFEKAQ